MVTMFTEDNILQWPNCRAEPRRVTVPLSLFCLKLTHQGAAPDRARSLNGLLMTVFTEDNVVRRTDRGAQPAESHSSVEPVLSRLCATERRPHVTQSQDSTATGRLWGQREPRNQQKVCCKQSSYLLYCLYLCVHVSVSLCVCMCLSVTLYECICVSVCVVAWCVVMTRWLTSWVVILRTPRHLSISSDVSTLSVITIFILPKIL